MECTVYFPVNDDILDRQPNSQNVCRQRALIVAASILPRARHLAAARQRNDTHLEDDFAQLGRVWSAVSGSVHSCGG